MYNKLVGALLALRSRGVRYQPEKHYMRGPGPKTLSKLGEMYRAETESQLRDRVPDQWLTVIRTIRDREHDR